jgi:hypothetical protein
MSKYYEPSQSVVAEIEIAKNELAACEAATEQELIEWHYSSLESARMWLNEVIFILQTGRAYTYAEAEGKITREITDAAIARERAGAA